MSMNFWNKGQKLIMAVTKKTDNHYLADKIFLRLRYANLSADPKILDCYGGMNKVWSGVHRLSGNPVNRISIDKRNDLLDFHLHGDNEKILPSMDLSSYDVFDLDAYGIPYKQLCLIFENRQHPAIVFVTMIQTMYGQMPKGLLVDIGFSETMFKKSPTLFGKRGWAFFLQWLAFKGVKKVVHRSKKAKHYMVFGINGAELSAADYNNCQEDKVAGLS